jgi:hypothetical protein
MGYMLDRYDFLAVKRQSIADETYIVNANSLSATRACMRGTRIIP